MFWIDLGRLMGRLESMDIVVDTGFGKRHFGTLGEARYLLDTMTAEVDEDCPTLRLPIQTETVETFSRRPTLRVIHAS